MKNINIPSFFLALLLMFSTHSAVAGKSPAKITGYAPGDIITLGDIEFAHRYFNDEIIGKKYLVKSKSKKSKGKYTAIYAVKISENQLAIYRVDVTVDFCDGAVDWLSASDRKSNDVLLKKCKQKAKGLQAQLPKIYGTSYNYYSNYYRDDNFDPASKCAVEQKSIHGMHIKCDKWYTPPANRLSVTFEDLIGKVHTRIFNKTYAGGVVEETVESGDGVQIVFSWHNEILEEKLKIKGKSYLSKRDKKENAKAAKSSDLFD